MRRDPRARCAPAGLAAGRGLTSPLQARAAKRAKAPGRLESCGCADGSARRPFPSTVTRCPSSRWTGRWSRSPTTSRSSCASTAASRRATTTCFDHGRAARRHRGGRLRPLAGLHEVVALPRPARLPARVVRAVVLADDRAGRLHRARPSGEGARPRRRDRGHGAGRRDRPVLPAHAGVDRGRAPARVRGARAPGARLPRPRRTRATC